MKHIKSINEFFDVGVFGDTYGYGGANGIFKVTYKPFSDLSVTVGPDPDIPRNISGSQFQVGDIVIGIPVDKKDSKVAGMLVRVERDEDNDGYRYFAQVMPLRDEKTKKVSMGERVIELKPDSVSFVDKGDKGHMQIVSQFKFADIPSKAFNSPTVFNSSDLGIETVGG